MAYKALPDSEYLHKVLSYCPDTGTLTWRDRPAEDFKTRSAYIRWNKLHAGKPAFACGKNGQYRNGTLNGIHYYAHRIAWKMTYGHCPEEELDHINGDRTDNRIANLRGVTRLGNTQNRKVRIDSKTGVPGVYWEKACNKWRAEIKANKQRINLGVFEALDDAIAARKAAELKYGFHPNHGRSS